ADEGAEDNEDAGGRNRRGNAGNTGSESVTSSRNGRPKNNGNEKSRAKNNPGIQPSKDKREEKPAEKGPPLPSIPAGGFSLPPESK
ncbi:MAG: hypothetical protein ACKOTB_09675, partial [Planctomycetia bacterium]